MKEGVVIFFGLWMLHVAIFGVCNYRVSKDFAKFCALSTVACFIVWQLVFLLNFIDCEIKAD
jgi:hypothetical protein